MKRERRKRPGMPPLATQLFVAWRQIGILNTFGVPLTLDEVHTRFDRVARRVPAALQSLAAKIGCEPSDLQLDHDPMLRVRKYKPRNGQPIAAWYEPHAHDPAHLVWRSKRPQDAGSHHTKTYVRGEHGQYSDVALAKRERRRERKELLKTAGGRPVSVFKAALGKPRSFKPPKRKWPSRPFPKRAFSKRTTP